MKKFLSFTSILFFSFSLLFSQVNPDSVLIVRDIWGVAHVFGNTDADAIYGLAWAHAEDDFFTIQENLAMARGRLGELSGKQGAMYDYAVHLMRAQETVAAKYEKDVSPAFKKILEAYTDAMNLYAQTHPDEVRLKGLFPAVPQDILAGYMMSLALMSGVPPHIQNILEGKAGAPTAHSLRGSNGFAFNSHKTMDESVMLVNNPHQPLDGAVSWYEAHIVSNEGLNTLGALFPGGVSIFTGCNPNLAWMHTVNYDDYVDVYELETDPEDELRYKVDGEWLQIEERKIKLKVKLGLLMLPIPKKVWWSIYGPVLYYKKKAYAIRFAALFDIRSAEQWFRMNKAKNFEEFKEVLNMQALPSLNIVYADKDDNILYLDNSMMPVRKPGYDWVGLVPGNTRETIWNKYHPLKDLPSKFNPDCGYVYNTNASPLVCTTPKEHLKESNYPKEMGLYLTPNNRSIRLQKLIDEYGKISWDELRIIKFDRSYPDSVYAYWCMNIDMFMELDPTKYPDIAAEIIVLKNWDRSAGPESQGAALFLIAFQELFNYVDEKGWMFERRVYSEDVFVNCIHKAQDYLTKHFKTIQVSLGELQRHVRGDRNWPVGGLPDMIATMYSTKWEHGRRRSRLGDSYIQLVQYTREGEMYIETVHPYGASNHKGNPHFDDQVDLYVNQKLKEMTLDKNRIMQSAERKYHPGK